MEFLQLTILGLCSGSMLALSAQGLVLIYRGSGVLNLAHAGMGSLAAFLFWDLREHHHQPFVVALLVGIAASGLVGLALHLFVMRPLRTASALTRLVATLAVLVIIQTPLQLHYGSDQRIVHSILPSRLLKIGSIQVGEDRLLLLAISVFVTVFLYLAYKKTRFGIATTATAENGRAAAALGLSPSLIAGANWVFGASLAALASILLAPIIQVQLVTQSNLIVPVLAAALFGGMRSFPMTFAGGALVGISQTLVSRYVSTPGWPDAIPFLLIIVVMTLRGRGISGRPDAREIRPRVGSGRIRPAWALAGVLALGAVIQWVANDNWVDTIVLTTCVGLILMSSVVVTGYAGQLSLCQFSLGGAGAVIAGLLAAKVHVPFLPAFLLAVLLSFPVGILVGLPALRARGINLAIVTLGLAAATESVLFLSTTYTGGAYVTVPAPRVFGLSLDSLLYPRRYALFCLLVFVLAAIAVVNLRRGGSGRRLIAVRSNERAAAALGVDVLKAKLYAFALSSSIAAAGGVLLVFRQTNLSFIGLFDPPQSINGVLYSVVGGIGFVLGPVAGSIGEPAGVISTIFNSQGNNLSLWVTLALAVLTIPLLRQNPDGLVKLAYEQARWVGKKTGFLKVPRSAYADGGYPEGRATSVVPQVLEIRDLTVGFGGVTALSNFSAAVAPGQVLGIIGPNGAGKTTLIEAISGFVRPRGGSVTLGGTDISGWPAHRRARAGLCRTFQSLELFDDITVAENLKVAADSHSTGVYASDLVWPRQVALPDAAVAAVREFDLGANLDRHPDDLSYGQRRLVAIARSVAVGPSVLCLDEPAAGLSSAERGELVTVIRKLADEWGMAVILIEHDVDLVMSVSDELVVLNFGQTIAKGSPATVRSNPAVKEAYLGPDDPLEDDRVAGTTRVRSVTVEGVEP